MKFLKTLWILSILISLTLFIIGATKHPLIPYQDPTQAMIIEQNKAEETANQYFTSSLFFVVVSVVLFCIWLYLRKKKVEA